MTRSSDQRQRLDTLIASVREHPTADLYRAAWGDAGTFEELPSISRRDIVATPLARRHYASDIGMVKVVRDPSGSFLSPWSFADIARESFGAISKRPMVYLSDPHEAIEKSMWCYERGMLPVIGEKDAQMAMFAAGKYEIDSLIADPVSLLSFEPFLVSRTLASITVISDTFEIGALSRFGAYASEVRLVLALPETGAIAVATLAQHSRFSLVRDCIIERDEHIVVTKLAPLLMPIIKYDTRISSEVLRA